MSGRVFGDGLVALGLGTVRPEHLAPGPRARAHRNGVALSVAHNTVTAVPFTTLAYEQPAGDLWASATDTRLTATRDGLWLVAAGALFAASAGGARRQLQVRLDGATQLAVHEHPSGTGLAFMTAATPYPLERGQYVDLAVFQDSGAALNLDGGVHATWLALAWLGP